MNEVLLNKFRQILDVVREQRDGLSLFGLFELENAPNKWDVVIAATWVSEDTLKQDLDYIAGLIREHVTSDEVVQLSRVVLLRPEDTFVQTISRAFEVPSGTIEIRNSVFNGLLIRHAYLFSVARPNATRASGGAIPTSAR